MTLLQKKCLVASFGAHGLLLVVLLVASAFRSEPDVTEDQVLTVISPRILDEAGSGGEAPPAVTPPSAAPATRPAPTELQARASQPPRSVPLSTPKQRADRPATERPSTSDRPAPKTHEVIPDLTHTTRGAPPAKPSDSSANTARSEAAARSEEAARDLSELANSVRSSGAKATVVTLPGEGGGEAFVGYETAVYNAYYHAWKTPDDAAGSLASADVKIVVARDGSIISAQLITPSGDTAMDRSVRQALEAVKQLPPFPEKAQDAQRSFKIRFSLEGKQSSG